MMTKHLVSYVTYQLNSFPNDDAISKTLSPAVIVEGSHKVDLRKEIIPFGSYSMIYTSTTNNMKSRAAEAIALNSARPRGGYYFMNLQRGKLINRYKWTVLPITERVLEDIYDIATDKKQPMLPNKGEPTYEWNPGVIVNNNWDPINNENEIDNNNNNE